MFLRNAGTSGKYNAAGLPDISGELYGGTIFDVASGALRPAHSNEHGRDTGGISGNDGFVFRASLSNPTYGAQSTVMPESADILCGLYLGRPA